MPSVGILYTMSVDRITAAFARIEAATSRIDAAREAASASEARTGASSARVIELVNDHEKLREQVAESLRELDDLLAQLEG
jgi:flagellin-like hook-associated protein FlgL